MNTSKKMSVAAIVFFCVLDFQSCELNDNNRQRSEQIEGTQENKDNQEPNIAIPIYVGESIADPEPIVLPGLGAPAVPAPVGLLPIQSSGGSRGSRNKCLPAPQTNENAADITDQSRSSTYNGFLRGIWVPHGFSVNKISLGIRGFFTADSFFDPPSTVDMYLDFVGNFFRDNQDFVIMNCRPTLEQLPSVEPILATWPNVFAAIVADLAGPSQDCSTPGLTPGEKQICLIAIQYQDSLQTVYSFGVAEALQLGEQTFATMASTDALRRDYGIFPEYTGLGFTVQDSVTSTGAVVPMTTADIMRNSVVPEYLLKSVALAAANCRCLQVPASEALHTELIDPDDIWLRGQLDESGACRMVNHLSPSPR